MKSVMHIGNTGKGIKQIGKKIIDILKAGHKYHTSENVLIEAINKFSGSTEIGNVNITSCHFEGKKKIKN